MYYIVLKKLFNSLPISKPGWFTLHTTFEKVCLAGGLEVDGLYTSLPTQTTLSFYDLLGKTKIPCEFNQGHNTVWSILKNKNLLPKKMLADQVLMARKQTLCEGIQQEKRVFCAVLLLITFWFVLAHSWPRITQLLPLLLFHRKRWGKTYMN